MTVADHGRVGLVEQADGNAVKQRAERWTLARVICETTQNGVYMEATGRSHARIIYFFYNISTHVLIRIRTKIKPER